MAEIQPEQMISSYLERLERLLRRAPAAVRRDALQEVRTHIEDEWKALGSGLPALQTVLERMGKPEEYGRDLAFQLILAHPQGQRSPGRLVLALIFWAGSSLLGAVVVVFSLLVLVYALGMLATGVAHLLGYPLVLFHASEYQAFGYHAANVRFPPADWSPWLILAVGLLPAAAIFASLDRILMAWARSRLAQHGLGLANRQPAQALPKGWERRAVLAAALIAVFSLAACLAMSIISEMVPIGQSSSLSLPQDFFKTPLTALAFLFGLAFLCAPVLGLLWASRHPRK